MYYGECTPAYAVEVVKEILANAESDRQALATIHNFMSGELSTEEVAGMIEGSGETAYREHCAKSAYYLGAPAGQKAMFMLGAAT